MYHSLWYMVAIIFFLEKKQVSCNISVISSFIIFPYFKDFNLDLLIYELKIPP